MTTLMHMNTDEVRGLATLMNITAQHIGQNVNSLLAVVLSIDWISDSRNLFERDFQEYATRILEHAQVGSALSQRVNNAVSLWESTASDFTGGEVSVMHIPTPVPTPAHTQGMSDRPIELGISPGDPIRNLFDFFENLSKPIDWTHDNTGASKQLHEVFQNFGRYLNQIGNTRGNIKLFDNLATSLEGGADALAKAGDIVALNDFRLYFGGELTNAQVLKTAVSNFPIIKQIPVPFLADTLSNFLLPYLPDPDGKWCGKVY